MSVAALACGLVIGGAARAQTDAPATVTPASAPAGPAQAPAQPQAPALSAGVAALVNDDVISTYDLRQRTLLLLATSGVPATQENIPQIQQEALRSLLDESLQMQELRKMEKQQKFSIIADESEVDEALANLAKENNSNAAELKRQFAKVGLDVQTLRDQLRVQISWSRMISGRYGTRVHIGADQVAMALQRIKAASAAPQYQISEIFVDASRAGGMNEAMNGAQQLINQINQGAPFGPVARQFSSDPSAANNGDMGWVSAAELVPELASAVEQMRPGQISQPIPVADGVYVLQLKEKRTGGASESVHLKQAAVRLPQDAKPDQIEAARKILVDFQSVGATCSDLEAKAAGHGDLIAGDLGESEVSDLAPDFRTAAEGLSLNQFSNPIRTPVGLHLIMVCGRGQSKSKTPEKADIENRLYGEQLAMLSRRYLRDLRNTATIEQP
jgi:peptidyl-prolyl cis-trans isomerase SurA